MKYISIVLFLSCFLYPQTQDEIIKIAKVSVVGNVATSENTILFTAGLREGQTITPADFPRAIKRLWQLGLFQDVQIKYDEESDEGLSLSINVKENYILGQIVYKGNKKIKDRKFDDEITLSKGQRIKPNTIRETKELIRNLYIDKGYLNVSISPQLSMPKGETILFGGKGKELVRDIVFTIQENKKIKIDKIIFEGNEAFSDFRLRWQMKETKQQSWYFFWRSSFDKKKFEDDMSLVSTFYRNKGYRDFQFISDSVQYSSDGKKMNIVFTVNEGPQYKYRNFSWEGMTLFNQEVLDRSLALDIGENYSDEDFNMAVFSRVQGLYLDRGYIYSRIEPKITPVQKDSLDIHFVITENHKVYINQISIAGNTRTRENVIRRQLRVFPGDVYNQDLIARSYREVMMLNYFANAAPNILPLSEDKINIEFTVEEKPAGQASANMGYSQYYGLTGGGGLSLPNFRGKGQSFSFSYNEGINSGSQSTYMYQGYNVNRPKSRRASISFTDPMVNDTKNLLGASLGFDMRGGGSAMYYSPLETTSAYGSIVWGRIFKWPDDFFRGTWRFMVRRRSYSGSQSDLDSYAGGKTKTDGISFVQTIRRDSRDHPEFPTIGSHFSLNSTLSGWILGGQENFHKHTLTLDWFTPTFWKFVLMNSMKIGVIKDLPSRDGTLSYIPFYDRFVMGGNGIPYGNPLRGYDDNRVGPVTLSGNPIGGNAMIKFGTEFRVPFAENPVVYGIIFAEMGNVWSSVDLMERLSLPRSGPLDLKRSLGAGIRFFMPMIGMLGFDIGYGFDRVNAYGELEPGWKTTLTFGQQF
jgi:outer membrane protein insertion porin family